MGRLIDEDVLIRTLLIHGQRDTKFKLGEIIHYNLAEYEQIIKDEVPTETSYKDVEEILRVSLNLLLDWVISCDFGYDNIPEQYELYRTHIEAYGMNYVEGMKYIVMQEAAKRLGRLNEKEFN